MAGNPRWPKAEEEADGCLDIGGVKEYNYGL